MQFDIQLRFCSTSICVLWCGSICVMLDNPHFEIRCPNSAEKRYGFCFFISIFIWLVSSPSMPKSFIGFLLFVSPCWPAVLQCILRFVRLFINDRISERGERCKPRWRNQPRQHVLNASPTCVLIGTQLCSVSHNIFNNWQWEAISFFLTSFRHCIVWCRRFATKKALCSC